MQGTILILDGVATNRIMLKVQLSSAYYRVVQSDCVEGLVDTVRRTLPDLIITAMTLPDGDAIAVRDLLRAERALASIPVVAITEQNDKLGRLTALAAGLDDVLSHPLDDVILQARIRSLIRARDSADDLSVRDGTSSALGFAEPVAAFATAARIALVTQDAATGAIWQSRLKSKMNHHLQTHRMTDIHGLMSAPVPDAIVVEVTGPAAPAGLRLLADLHARTATRHAAIIAVTGPGAAGISADALDRGAHDVMQEGFFADELALRISLQLKRKARADQLRATVKNGLRAAVLDPMTGLYNRRYALPRLASIAREAAENGHQFALMLADLDHFKQINDQYGHPAGDAVLIETARRLRSQLRPCDMIARVGGEEFMVVMPETDGAQATRVADRLCREINSKPFVVDGLEHPISLTTSIGLVVAPPQGHCLPNSAELTSEALIQQADRALYKAKDAGRNQVTLFQDAA
ncbi:MAG: diguanylate cyclase [Sedimentitalea sp.]